jgi:5'-3' exonuclease
MGIAGLLVALKSYLTTSLPAATKVFSDSGWNTSDNPAKIEYNGNIYESFQGQAVAIDASSWFHKSVYSIADHYVECIERMKSVSGTPQVDQKCISTSTKYMIARCYELLSSSHHHSSSAPHKGGGVSKLYLVMDGQRCPLKAVTNQERDEKRRKALELARKYKSQQQHDKMQDQYRSCIKIVDALSYTVAKNVQDHFAQSGDQVEIIWSPYEADAQLVQLCGIERKCAAVITEDSDVLVYSAACEVSFPIIFKLDRKSGNCSILSMDWLIRPMQFRNEKSIAAAMTATSSKASTVDTIFDILVGRQIQKPGWGTRLFVQGCVLAGCDYSPRGQIPGVGFVNAFKHVQVGGILPNQLSTLFDRVLKTQLTSKSRRLIALNNDTMHDLEIQLAQSEAVFYYHPVLKSGDVSLGSVQFLNHPPVGADDAAFKDPIAFQHPCLDRFQDVSFLGSLCVRNVNADCGIIPKHILQPHAHRKPSNTGDSCKLQILSMRSNRRKRPLDIDENNVPPEKTSGLIQVRKSIPMTSVVNPYSRKPLQSMNAFEVYSHRHREVGISEVNRIVTAKLPVRNKTKHQTSPHPVYHHASTQGSEGFMDVRAKRNDKDQGVIGRRSTHEAKNLPPVQYPSVYTADPLETHPSENEQSSPTVNKNHGHRSHYFDYDVVDDSPLRKSTRHDISKCNSESPSSFSSFPRSFSSLVNDYQHCPRRVTLETSSECMESGTYLEAPLAPKMQLPFYNDLPSSSPACNKRNTLVVDLTSENALSINAGPFSKPKHYHFGSSSKNLNKRSTSVQVPLQSKKRRHSSKGHVWKCDVSQTTLPSHFAKSQHPDSR